MIKSFYRTLFRECGVVTPEARITNGTFSPYHEGGLNLNPGHFAQLSTSIVQTLLYYQ